MQIYDVEYPFVKLFIVNNYHKGENMVIFEKMNLLFLSL